MDETIKEISSRTGHYNSGFKKFVKDNGAYSFKDAKDKYPEADREIHMAPAPTENRNPYFYIEKDGECLD